jgi:hypothetical protein
VYQTLCADIVDADVETGVETNKISTCDVLEMMEIQQCAGFLLRDIVSVFLLDLSDLLSCLMWENDLLACFGISFAFQRLAGRRNVIDLRV